MKLFLIQVARIPNFRLLQLLANACGDRLRCDSVLVNTAFLLALSKSGGTHPFTFNFNLQDFFMSFPAFDINFFRDNTSALLTVVRLRQPNLLREFLKIRNIDRNIYDKEGFTPLMKAAQFGRLEEVQLLSEFPGIELNRESFNRDTALSLASQTDALDVVKYLTPRVSPDFFTWAFIIAREHNQILVAQFLARLDFDLNSITNKIVTVSWSDDRYIGEWKSPVVVAALAPDPQFFWISYC